MKQIVQYQKNGELVLEEVPIPQCPKNGILVKLKFSLISAGTEKSSVSNAQGSLIDRAKKQPDQVKLVLDTIKQHGLISTYQRVQNKLHSFKPLGYSASGVVVESKCQEFKIGDKVSVGGANLANHSQYVAIPKNLAVHIPEGVSFEDASYGTVGSIAMQGVRQASPMVGETVGVIGLGLLGLITIQILKSSGCRVVGFDINEGLFEDAYKSGADLCLVNNSANVQSSNAFTRGIGFDSVIITAGTSSSEPLNLALEMTRKRGVISLVGAVGLNVDRGKWYSKEIDLKISCSYGPGRYDPSYEEDGLDYPISYVRWTENRNIQSILDLIESGNLDVKSISTHTFDMLDASDAYKMITSNSEKYIGILIKYPEDDHEVSRYIFTENKVKSNKDSLNLSFIGLGQFAQNYLLPPLKKLNLNFYGVSNSTPISSKTAANVNEFELSATTPNALIYDEKTDIVFIASSHSSHASYVLQSLNAQKPVYCEKPLCVTIEELEEIRRTREESNGRVMVGFNRRFSEPFEYIKSKLAKTKQPISIAYRVNAGKIPLEHWVHNDENKGRIIGEVCHFVDTLVYLTGSLPIRVYAESVTSTDDSMPNNDICTISIKFENGSIGRIDYFANGGKQMDKEYCEVFANGISYKMNNFESVEVFNSKSKDMMKFSGEKGINKEVIETIKSIKTGNDMPISFEEIYYTTKTTFAILESLSKASPVNLI